MKKFIRALMFGLVFMAYTAPLWAQEVAEVVATGDVKNSLMVALITAVVAFLTAITGVIGTYLGKLLNRKIKDIDNDAYQKIAYAVVRWVIDKHEKLPGVERYNKAMEKMAEKCPGASKEDLDTAVRSMFVNMASELGVKAKAPKKLTKK